ncbi:hypothetical protein ACQKQD_17995 [Methylobacterium sp. NPDC080182]|uniref:hypothetical protein n=1 Tax=Methylobacterium sp. NPDC080182 TaxID=3390590 RepID=UPI003D02182A
MIKLDTPKHGRLGDLFLTTPPAPMAVQGLDRPDTRHGLPSYSLGLQLDDLDMRAVADAMRHAFRTAYPKVEGPIRLPFRRTRLGQWLLFAETTKTPVILDGDGAPIPPPPTGTTIVMNARIAPYSRPDKGRQGCGLYLNRIRLAPAATDRETTT